MAFEILGNEEIRRSGDVVSEWRNLMARSANLYALYGSPEWIDHLSILRPPEDVSVVIQRDASGDLMSVVPLRRRKIDLGVSADRFSMSLGRIPCLEVMGGQPNLPETMEAHDTFFDWVWRYFPRDDAIYFKSIHNSSFFWKFIEHSGERVNKAIIYKVSGDRPFHSLNLPDSFDEYLGAFKHEKRNGLKRKVRRMKEANDGQLALERVSTVDQLARFEEAVRKISARSWKQEALAVPVPGIMNSEGALEDVARRGLLRSYLLQGKGGAIAFVLGYQYRDVFHYADIGFDQQGASLSPGNVLLFLLIKEIIENSTLKKINFGIEDGDYKRQFGNDHAIDASVLLLRPTFSNRRRLMLHGAAAKAKQIIRRFVKGR